MSLFYKREKEVRGLIKEYFETADQALEEFELAMRCFFEDGPCEEFREIDKRVHAAESRADDLVRQIELMLYSRSLLPESRGDLLGLQLVDDQLTAAGLEMNGDTPHPRVDLAALGGEALRRQVARDLGEPLLGGSIISFF